MDYDHPDLFEQLYQTGGFWIMRKETYLSHKWNSSIPINGVEKGISQYNEDIDLSKRIHQSGIKMCFDKENTVWHYDDNYMEFRQQTLKKEVISQMGLDMFKDRDENFTKLISTLSEEDTSSE